MRIHIIAVGQRMPDWVNKAYNEYHKRLPSAYQPNLKQVAAEKRGKSCNSETILQREGKRILQALPSQCHKVVLDRNGKSRTTLELSRALNDWANLSVDVAFLIGGPEGLSKQCLEQADEQWSLSAMTFPHALVRVMLIEQLYRAWTILNNMPYHR
ncbi:MAG TPA: 23S rRNA (pseudouridine(1915)-N(3))-methyltransferase RlmH [Acidiferrobacteraceae bacterium]|nr:23S rRNA (pseudouridine(1915)-N(3))-methyltransferase RlmH [Acidiferrobacteraceae bacterium]HEX20050.1 23S rRNA (pseudouridine(1915)-N(3))-methyltransferase RlmH [Acidiferrobacteraceae bacterium]